MMLIRDEPRSKLCVQCIPRRGSGETSGNWKGGLPHSQGYVFVLCPEHPKARVNGYVKRARLVLEEKLGRYLLDGYSPHHINRIRDDDRPENLEELNRSEHQKLHMAERKGIKVDSYCCGNCALQYEKRCPHYQDIVTTTFHSACNSIHYNFIDRGYTHKFQKIDFFPPKDMSVRSKDA